MPNLPMHTVNLPGIDNPIELVDKQGREDLATLEQEVIAITPPENIDISSDGVKVMSDYDLNELGWGVQDDDYYFTTTAEFSLGDRTYTKENAKPALGAVVGTPDGMNNRQIVLVSTDAEATYFDWGSYHNRQGISFTYLGHTWYYSGGNAAYYGTPASGIGVIADDTLSLEDAAKYLIDVSVVYFDDGVFSAITEPNSGYLLAGGGSQADYSDAKFTVSKTGIVTAVDIVVNTESLPIAIHRVRDNECKAYYAGSTYNTGDRVIYLNQYYKCKEDGVTGAWNYSKWEAWTLDKEIESVREEVANLPNPMIFKGTLGTSGTIQDLPTASSANEGFTYKVIEDGTYGSVPAKAGDVFVSNGSVWILIPAGDDVEDTWRNVKVNGVEKLTSLISSGAIDFINGTNTEVVFDENNNTLQINAVDTTYPTLSQEDATAGVSETASTITAKVLKTTVDDAIADESVTKTVSGNPVVFSDGSDAPLVSCTSEIVVEQDLHGYDKPWVGGAGKNLIPDGTDTTNGYVANAYLKIDDTTGYDGNLYVSEYFPVSPGNYMWSTPGENTPSIHSASICFYDEQKQFVFGVNMERMSPKSITVPSGCSYARSTQYVEYDYYLMFESGTVASSTFSPYKNICPISGYDRVEIEGCGKNLFDEVYTGISSSVTYRPIKVKNGTYTMSSTTPLDGSSAANLFFFAGNVSSGGSTALNGVSNGISRTVTTNDGYITVAYRNQSSIDPSNYKTQIELGTSATDYEPYKDNSYTISLGSTRYGGTLDVVRGVLRVTHGYGLIRNYDIGRDSTRGYFYALVSDCKPAANNDTIANIKSSAYEAYTANNLINGATSYGVGVTNDKYIVFRNDDYTTISDFKTAMFNQQVVYELATQLEISLTPTQVRSLLGSNYLSCNTGDLEVQYITQSYQPIIDITEDYADKVSEEAASNLIDDTTTSETKVWSSNKTSNAISNAVDNISVDDLTDVEITNPANGDNLTYNGTKWVNTEPKTVTKTITGNPIDLSDSASAPIVKCVTEIQGSQDLHGYDKPWVGGAGKNKCDFSDVTTTSDRFVIGGNGDYAWINADHNAIPAETITFSADVSGANGSSVEVIYYNGSSGVTRTAADVTNNRFVITTTLPSQANKLTLYCNSSSGGIFTNFQLELGSTATTFAPYSNICPITAYTEGEIEVRGKNLFDKNGNDVDKGYISDKYIAIQNNQEEFYTPSSGYWYVSEYIQIESSTQYVLSGLSTNDSNAPCLSMYDENKNFIKGIVYQNARQKSITTPLNSKFIRISVGPLSDSSDNIQLEKGTTATTYEPYVGTTHTTTYPSAIYRGSEDVVNGKVQSDYTLVDLGSLTWTLISAQGASVGRFQSEIIGDAKVPSTATIKANMVCDCFEVSNTDSVYITPHQIGLHTDGRLWVSATDIYEGATAFKTAMSGHILAYEKSTPVESSVTPTNLPIRTLSGYNHIESSTGDMEVEYITEEYQPLVDLIEDAVELPAVTSLDDGKVLTVVDGKWVAASLPVGQNIQY